jgi:hypothetical protein
LEHDYDAIPGAKLQTSARYRYNLKAYRHRGRRGILARHGPNAKLERDDEAPLDDVRRSTSRKNLNGHLP